MQDTTPPTRNQTSLSQLAIPGAILALVAVAAIALYTTRGTEDTATLPTATPVVMENSAAGTSQMVGAESGIYRDGEYQATGSYITPGGPREVAVVLTLEDGVITGSEFEGLATDPTSQRFQGEFADNYEAIVVGKNIEEVQLTKVSGSSLTPQGFMNALEQIKNQAQS